MKLNRAIIAIAVLTFSFTLSIYADIHMPEVNWTTLYSKQGILVEKGSVVGSSYHALRGTGIVQTNIGRTISILYQHTRANEWVHQLLKSRDLRSEQLGSIIWQHFYVPWPAENRDFVYFAKPTYDENKKYFQVVMTDILDTDIALTDTEYSRIPNPSCCVRGKLIYGSWQIRPIGPETTCVRIEVLLDPKGLLPAFIVNQFQKNWPFATIEGLQAQGLKEDITLHEKFGNWVADRPVTQIKTSECRSGQLDH